MIQLMAALQPLLINAVLLWSARVKLIGRHAAAGAHRSALVPLVGERRAVPAYRLLGGVELTIGILLVLPPPLPIEAVAATGLATGFLAYLWYARTAPDSSCGCMSARRTPVSWRGFARAGILVLGGLLATLAADSWASTVATHPVAGGAVLLAEAAAIIALSPELDAGWLMPLRRLRAHLTHPLTKGSGIPLLASVQQLQLSEVYRHVAALLTSDVREHWEDDQWRIVCYAARYQGRSATAVFAVPLLRHDPDEVRVALIDEATGVNLLNLDSISDVAGPDADAAATADPAYAG